MDAFSPDFQRMWGQKDNPDHPFLGLAPWQIRSVPLSRLKWLFFYLKKRMLSFEHRERTFRPCFMQAHHVPISIAANTFVPSMEGSAPSYSIFPLVPLCHRNQAAWGSVNRGIGFRSNCLPWKSSEGPAAKDRQIHQDGAHGTMSHHRQIFGGKLHQKADRWRCAHQAWQRKIGILHEKRCWIRHRLSVNADTLESDYLPSNFSIDGTSHPNKSCRSSIK